MAIQNSAYYFIHPSIDLFFTERIKAETYFNDLNIVGHQKLFRKPPPNFKNYLENHKEAKQFTPKLFAGRAIPRIKVLTLKKDVSVDILYEKLFRYDKESLIQFRSDMCTRAYHAILIISEFHFFYQFDLYHDNRFSNWQEKKQKQLLNYIQEIDYARPLKDLEDKELIHFGRRVVARTFILFCNIVLRLDYELIYDIIRHRRYEPKSVKGQAETALKFFRAHFFIKGLRDFPNSAQDLNSIIKGISELEKKCIKDWWAYLKESHLPKELNLSEEEQRNLPIVNFDQ